MYVADGRVGLGVLALVGLVKPSLVRSAVDAVLVVLLAERWRVISVVMSRFGFAFSVCTGWVRALVRSDCLRSAW